MVRDLRQVTKEDIRIVGGKAASLGEMLQIGVAVPQGFVVTTAASAEGISRELRKEILKAFDKLGTNMVAVRSSAISEDSESASWAGQLETYLNVTKGELIKAIQKCWLSIESQRAVAYALEHNVNTKQRKIAVVVQAMVNGEVSGVMFTANPINGSRNELMIEAGFGLGELIVQGAITPELIVFDKELNKIVIRNQHSQQKKLVHKNNKNVEVAVSTKLQNKDILTPAQITELKKIAAKVEKHYGLPQDIEWVIANDKLYIVQSRPITTLLAKMQDSQLVEFSKLFTREKGIWYAYLWNESDRMSFEKYLKYKVKNNLFVREGEKLSVWYDLVERGRIGAKLEKLLAIDKTFMPRLLEDLENEWKHLGPYLSMEKEVKNLQQLQDYYVHLRSWWLPMTILFTIGQTNLPAGLVRKEASHREKAEKYSDAMDVVWNTFWDSKASKYKKLMNLFTPEEAFSSDLLTPQQLERISLRAQGVGLLNGKRHLLNTLDSVLIKQNIRLEKETVSQNSSLITGNTAYKGIASGRVHLVLLKRDILTLEQGEILVADMTSPHFLPAIKKASAIVTDEGGVTCHAAIVSRELKKPCVIGTKIATQVLKNGTLVEVNANAGKVIIL